MLSKISEIVEMCIPDEYEYTYIKCHDTERIKYGPNAEPKSIGHQYPTKEKLLSVEKIDERLIFKFESCAWELIKLKDKFKFILYKDQHD